MSSQERRSETRSRRPSSARLVADTAGDAPAQGRVAAPLPDSEQRLRLALECAGIGMWDWSLDGTNGWVSPEMQRLFGLPEAPLERTAELYELIHPEDRGRVKAGIEEAMRSGAPYDVEHRIRRASDGQERWIRSTGKVTWVDGQQRFIGVSRDITPGRQAELSLEETEKFLRKVLDSSLAGIYIFDLDLGTNVFVNRQHTLLSGYTQEDFDRMTAADSAAMLHPEDLPKLLEHIRQLEEAPDGKALELDYRARTPHGRWFWGLSRHAVFQRRPDGSAKQLIGSFIDITARKQAEEELRRSEHRLRLAQQVSQSGVFDWDLTTGVDTWSSETEALYGLKPGEFGGRQECWEKLVYPEDREQIVEETRRSLESGEPHEGEFRVQWPDGSVHWLFARWQAIRNSAGRVERLTGVNMDITRRKEMEEALREREERLSSILRTVADAVITLDAGGTITSVNPATELIFGFSQSELVGRSVNVLIPSDSHQRQDRPFASSFRAGSASAALVNSEAVGRRKDGTSFPAELSWSEASLPRSCTVVIRDVSARKALESEVLRVSEAEQERLATDLHDGICQKLVAIAATAKGLQRQLEKQQSPLVAELGGIVGAVSEAAREARQIAQGLSPVMVSGDGLLGALRTLAANTSNDRAVRCSFRCDSPELVLPPAVSTQLFLIAQEAVRNSVRHSGATAIDVGLTRDDAEICVLVRDNGRGLPPHADKRKGLGLRGMRYRAGLIRGRLTVQNREGGGAEVRCCVPAGPVSSGPLPGAPPR